MHSNDLILLYWILNFIVLFIFFGIFFLLRKDYFYKENIQRLNKTLSLRVKEEVEKNKEQEISNYKHLFNSLPNAAWIINQDTGMIVDINSAAINIYGYTKDEFINMSVYDLDPRSDDEIDALLEQGISRGKDYFQTKHILKDKNEIDVIINSSKIVLDSKEYFITIMTDITENIKTHQELKIHQDILETIIYILNELIIKVDFNASVNNILNRVLSSLDLDRIYIFENHTIDNNLVCSQKFELVKNNISIELDNPQLQNVVYSDSGLARWKNKFENHEYIESITRELPESEFERKMLESQGIKSILVMPIWFEDLFWGFIGFDDCTTERVWSELEKDVLNILSKSFISALKKQMYSAELENQVASQVKEIRKQEMTIMQQSKLAQMGDMISMIAHQWRQPLNTISAAAMKLSILSSLGKLEATQVQGSSQLIKDKCQTMSSTIDTFMNFVKPTQEKKTFFLSHSVNSVLNIMGTQLVNHNIKVNVDVMHDISIMGFEDLIEQVIINILSNARDAFEDIQIENKFINIVIKKENDNVIVAIEDNAGGISQTAQDKIFNPYFTTKPQGKGTGIGLYMSLDIMQKSFNGNLIYKVIDGGSCFEIVCGEEF